MSRSSESSANVSECSIDIDEFTEADTVNHNQLSTSPTLPSVNKSNKIDKYKTLASTKPNEMKNLTFSISRLLDSSSSSTTTTTTNGLYVSKSKTDTDERCSPKSEDGSASSPSESSSTTSKTLAPKCSPPSSSFPIANSKATNGNHISSTTASYLINMNNNNFDHHHHHSNSISSSTSPNNSVIRVPAQRLPPLQSQSQSQSHSASNTPTNTTSTTPAIPYSVSYPWMTTHGTSGSPFIKDGYSSKYRLNRNELLAQSIKSKLLF